MRATPDILDKQFGLNGSNAKADLLADVFAAGYTAVTLNHALWLNGPLRVPANAWIEADAPDCWLVRATPEARLELESGAWISDVHVYGNELDGPNIVAMPGSYGQHLRDCQSNGCKGPALEGVGVTNGVG